MLLGTMFIYLTRWQNSYDYYDLNEEDSDLEGEGVFSYRPGPASNANFEVCHDDHNDEDIDEEVGEKEPVYWWV